MSKVDNVLLKAKFRGSMLGCLVGDCMGSAFEGDTFSPGMRRTVHNCIEKLDGPYFKAPARPYTDDTAMTISVAKCLIEKPAVDYTYMAKLFTEEYFAQPRRGYGGNIIEVFNKLKHSNYNDIYKPAREQFGGSGSFGNGGAMRVAPIALYFYNDYNAMITAARKTTEITHTNKLGVNGALLQCIAIHQCLQADPSNEFNAEQYTNDLVEKIKLFEPEDDDNHSDEGPTPYQTQMGYMKKLLDINDPNDPAKVEEVIGMLGNSVAALYSVPTAIYCFIKAHTGFPEIKSDNIFRRVIEYAVTLGGDTDTIASMAGAITGAYYGDTLINENLLKHCEYHKEMSELADNLYNAAVQDVNTSELRN